jgi:arylsulfatase A-like enzyme
LIRHRPITDPHPSIRLEPATPPASVRATVPFLPALAGCAAFLALQYAIALARLNQSSGAMANKFSALARDEHLGFLIKQNALLLPAYAGLALAALFLIRPWLALAARKHPQVSRTVILVPAAFTLTALLHGYFALRLAKTRPYFLDEREFGHWYYKAFDFIPEPVKPAVLTAIFTLLPIACILIATAWWLHRMKRRGRILTAATLALIAAVVTWGAGNPQPHGKSAVRADDSPPNILIIGSDSIRGDRLGCAGHRPARSDGPAAAGVSPHIDALAAKSARFERCYTAIASTIESGVQMMASNYPHTHGIRQMYPDRETVAATNQRVEPLAAILRAKGYDTAAIGDWCAGYYEVTPLGFGDISVSSFDNFRIYMSQAVVMAHFVIPLYFDNPLGYRMFPQLQSFAQFVTPKVVTDRVERRIASAARDRQPFFWHVFYSCNHLPYRSTEPYVSMFTDPSYSGPNKSGVAFDIDEFIGGTDLESKWKALPEKEIRQIRSLYDGCTRLFDDCVGRIIASLQSHGLADNTIIIITGDHGDDLYEPGVTLGHGLTFNGALHANHVPMIVHVPGQPPRVIPETVRLIDVAPTLAELTGVTKPESWEGIPFTSWLKGSGQREHRPFYGETGFPFIQFSVAGVERPQLPPMDEMTMIDGDYNHQFVLRPEYRERLVAAKQRCLRTRDWKLVCTPTATGTRHFGLFHLVTDPHAETDLSTSRPEVLTPMRAALEKWMDQRAETPISGIFPGGEPG